MATLSWSLISALDQSVTPPSLRHTPVVHPDAKQGGDSKSPFLPTQGKDEIRPISAPALSMKEQASPQEQTVADEPGLNHFSDGLDEDIYWNDGSV